MQEINWVINFELPESYAKYKEIGSQIDRENGAMLNLINTEEE